MAAYYNEYDPKAAAWLRELIKQGHIADGVVDDRSIEDVTPTELLGFTQCHFFAGIGVWSYALRRAGWVDDRPVWTGSCPCQPFSAAGKGAGFDDERHLWPAFHHLISQCQPPIVLGEQVASKDGLGWLDLVHADLEATGYASGAVDLCAAGIGAPHIRQRLWWVGTRLADTNDAIGGGQLGLHTQDRSDVRAGYSGTRPQTIGNVADTKHQRWKRSLSGRGQELGADSSGSASDDAGHGTTSNVANADNAGSQGRVSGRSDQGRQDQLGHGGRGGAAGGMADTASGGQLGAINARERGTGMVQAQPSRGSGSGGLADTKGNGWDEGKSFVGGGAEGIREGRSERRSADGAVGSMADTDSDGRGTGDRIRSHGQEHDAEHGGGEVGMADTKLNSNRGEITPPNHGWDEETNRPASGTSGCGSAYGGLADTSGVGRGAGGVWHNGGNDGNQPDANVKDDRPGPTNGHWRDADWLFCRDGKWRPVEPGTSPLAHGAAARVGRLRGYGNAIVAQAAQAFVESVMGE